MSYISNENKKNFQSIILADLIDRVGIKTIANGDDRLLEPYLIDMMSKGYVTTSGVNYVLTPTGKGVLDNFMSRYNEYLKLYDIYAFVDLDKAEFAFSSYFNFNTDEEWNVFKNNSRFEDLRIAVALFKKLNPAEIVFMSFINEGRFDTTSTGWQFDLLSDKIWEEINTICQSAYTPEQLGEAAMKDMIQQGAEILVSILKEEEARNSKIAEDERQSSSYTSQTEETVRNCR